ncbi:MAG: UDP-N-acetylmuramoyl-L-alanyl-D-glutamate--2,6-diaminopimelate ligase [Candidatus Omnitrophica bacterium]|nr:UDP-N-acetylmuramoyl-L-alanyl-D-glutamate--2,6-diaminopimelate ligase [Candidatus Omnitrophota bacterium]
MRLKDLIDGYADLMQAWGSTDIPAVWDDSRRVTPGSLFAALPPVSEVTRNGEKYITEAVINGAKVVIVTSGMADDLRSRFPGICFIAAQDPRAIFRTVVDRFYGHPSRKMLVVGITGTNGKTTITYFLEAIIKAAGKTSAVLGTVNYRVGDQVIPSKNTTQGFLDNQIFLADLINRGVDYAVMEVSSHALDQGRVALIDFRGAIFTNLTGDHLDYHKTMEAYFQAKASLFAGLDPEAFAVVNVDDPYGRRLTGMTRARVITYGINTPADVSAHIESFGLSGTRFTLRFFGQEMVLNTHFIGIHNIYNLLAAFAAGLGEGLSPELVKAGIESLGCVPGRLERVDAGQDYCVFIDYAHTDDGLKNVLECLKLVPHRRLIVVFGCGGERDRTKRPRMGRVACELADYAILTSDNPRSEDPDAIIAEIVPGFTRNTYEIVTDREAAIKKALMIAQKDDIVLLAGKGHENYQVLKCGTIDFIEKDIVMHVLAKGK